MRDTPYRSPIFRISFVGDVMAGNSCYKIGSGIASQFIRHRGVPWARFLSKLFNGTDEVFGNLESPITENEKLADKRNFLGCASFLSFLKRCGFTGMNVANNHILESGPEGFYETLDSLKRIGLERVGYEGKRSPYVAKLSKEGITVGIAGFNAIDDINNPNCYCSLNPDAVRAALSEMKDLDFRVLIFHWGSEYMPFPSPEQILQAREFIDWGADVIVGHHPHVVQPVERYKHGVIFYSLGNFIFDFDFSSSVRLGAVAQVELTKGRAPEYTLIPVYRTLSYAFHRVDSEAFCERVQKRLARANKLINDSQQYVRMAIGVRMLYRLLMFIHNLRQFPYFPKSSKRRFLKRIVSSLARIIRV